MVAAVAMAAVSAGAGAAFGATIGTLTVMQTAGLAFASSLAMGLVSSSLAPKPKAPSVGDFQQQAQDNVLTVRQAAAPRPIVFGTARVGGVYTFLHVTGSGNSTLHAVITVAGHSVRGFDALYLDDEVVPLDGSGNATGKYAGKVTCIFGLGTTAGDAAFHAALTADVGADMWGANHKQTGCAKAYLKFTYDSNLFGGSLPNASFVTSGYDGVEDVRDASTGWTDNAALCIAQYLRDTARGLGYLSANFDSDALIAAANDCDEMVTRIDAAVTFTAATTDVITAADASAKLRTGTRLTVASDTTLPSGLSAATNYFWISLTPTTGKLATSLANARAGTEIDVTDTGTGTHMLTVNAEPRYTLNGVIDTSESPDQVLPRLLSAMAGVKTESGGNVILLSGVWRAATAASIDEDVLDGGVSSAHRRSRGDLFNGAKGTFINPDDAWIQTDFPAVAPATYLTADSNVRSWRDVELHYTNSPSMAQRIVRIDLEKNRRQQTVSLPLTLAGMTHRAGDTVQITNAKRGWTDKTFHATRWALDPRDIGGANPHLGITIDAEETDATVYSWTPATDEAAMTPSPLTNLPSPFVVVVPGNPNVVESLYTTTNSSGVKAKATVSWSASDDAYVTEYQLEYKLSADSEWLIVGRTADLSLEIFDVTPGVYDFRVKAINRIGAHSDYAINLSLSVAGLSAPPSDMTGLTISAIGGNALLRWNRSTDLDVIIGGKVQFRHNKNQSGATWVTSVSIGEAVPGGETVAVLPLKEGTYLARFYDSSLIPAVNAGMVTTKAATVLTFANVTSISEHPTFAGTNTNTYVDGTTLELAGTTPIDDWPDFDAVADFDYNGGVSSSGTYDFAAGIDLTTVKRVRLNTTIAAAVVNDLDNIDLRTANIDSWESFDGDTGGDADVQIWVRETDDDPAASPTWSDWNRLESAEFNARGFDFQARMSSGDPAYNIHVTEVTVTVDEVV